MSFAAVHGIPPDGREPLLRTGEQPPSTFGCGHLDDLTDRPPHVLRRLSLGQRLGGRTATELAEDDVARPRLGVLPAEVPVHPIPEVRKAHPPSLRSCDKAFAGSYPTGTATSGVYGCDRHETG